MNKIIEKAYEIIQEDYDTYKQELPDLEIGDVCTFNDVWDGFYNIDPEEGSYTYTIGDNKWINYIWEVVQDKENVLETVIKIIDIELL